MLPPLKPIAMKERVSLVFVQKGQIDVKDGAFVVIDETGIRTHIPVGDDFNTELTQAKKAAINTTACSQSINIKV